MNLKLNKPSYRGLTEFESVTNFAYAFYYFYYNIPGYRDIFVCLV